MTDFVFNGLQLGAYGTIMADPPWSFRGYTAETTPHRSSSEPYTVTSTEILSKLPVKLLAARDCCLFMWAISSHLEQSFQLGNAWGFTYKARVFEWFKTTNDGTRTRMGMGHWSRQESETVLLFTRGSPKRKRKDVRSTIFAPIRQHSRKPDEQYERIEALVDGPYCELFATQYRRGWDGWGNQYPRAEAAFWRLTEQLNRLTGYEPTSV